MGIYATVLFALGMNERVAELADPRHDNVGRELEEEHLPKRIRLSKADKYGEPKKAGTD